MTASATGRTSIVEVDAADQAGWWSREADAIRATLREQFGTDLPGADLTEPRDPAQLRARLRTNAPGLTTITDRIRSAFDDDGACAVLVPSLGVAGVEVDEQRKALYSFASLLGDVMANHPEDTVVWDVRNRGLESETRVKASDSDRSAGYHTDAGYLPTPPKFFLLYASHAAECGGGLSLLRDGRIVLDQLTTTEEGRAAIEALSQPVPRRVSSNLHHLAKIEKDGLQYAPVLGLDPLVWRWSKRRTREFSSPEVQKAIDTVYELVKHGPGEFRLPIPTDGVMVIDNHAAMHARTGFTDQRRNLFRIRFHDFH